MGRFANTKLARMSNGRRCLIRDLGPVKGGKGLRHHEVVLELSLRGLVRFAMTTIRNGQAEQPAACQQIDGNLVSPSPTTTTTGSSPFPIPKL